MSVLFERLRTLAMLDQNEPPRLPNIDRCFTSPELAPCVKSENKRSPKELKKVHFSKSDKVLNPSLSPTTPTVGFVPFPICPGEFGSIKRQISLQLMKMSEEFHPTDSKKKKKERKELKKPALMNKQSIQSVDDWPLNLQSRTKCNSLPETGSESNSSELNSGVLSRRSTTRDSNEEAWPRLPATDAGDETDKSVSTEYRKCWPCFCPFFRTAPNLSKTLTFEDSSVNDVQRANTMNITGLMMTPTPRKVDEGKDERNETKDTSLIVMDTLEEPESEYENLWSDNNWVEPEDLTPIPSLGMLGRGIAGGVTGVFHIPTCNVYALKSTRFQAEISTFMTLKKIMGNKTTPQLMELSGLFLDENTNKLALVLEYMNLGSLHDYFTSQNRRCSAAQMKFIAREILLGLRTLHGFETPILHRDIKPNNILIESHGSVQIADYGLFVSLPNRQKKCEDQAGTVKYFSPERHRGCFSMPADIWALGVTLVECLIGTLLDPEELTDVKVASEVTSPLDFLDPKEWPRGTPIVNFIEKCLDPDPECRWSATQLLGHEFLLPPMLKRAEVFQAIPKNKELLDEFLTIIQKYIRVNSSRGKSDDEIWAHCKPVSHERRLENIVQWTGFTKDEVEKHVHEIYEQRNKIQKYKLNRKPSGYREHENSNRFLDPRKMVFAKPLGQLEVSLESSSSLDTKSS